MIVQSPEEMEKELVALRAFVEQCAMLLKCGGATVPARIEMELQWRNEDRLIKGALYARIEAARKVTKAAYAAVGTDEFQRELFRERLRDILQALGDEHAQA